MTSFLFSCLAFRPTINNRHGKKTTCLNYRKVAGRHKLLESQFSVFMSREYDCSLLCSSGWLMIIQTQEKQTTCSIVIWCFMLCGVCLEDKEYFINILIHLDDQTYMADYTDPVGCTPVVLQTVSGDRYADTMPQRKKCLLLLIPQSVFPFHT